MKQTASGNPGAVFAYTSICAFDFILKCLDLRLLNKQSHFNQYFSKK